MLRPGQPFTLCSQVNPDPLCPLSHFSIGGLHFFFDAVRALEPEDSTRERVNVLPHAWGSTTVRWGMGSPTSPVPSVGS